MKDRNKKRQPERQCEDFVIANPCENLNDEAIEALARLLLFRRHYKPGNEYAAAA